MPLQRLILDKFTGTILDASTDEVLLIEADTSLDTIEEIANNWDCEAAEQAARDLGWKVTKI